MTYFAAVVAETIRSLKQKDIQKIYENDSPFVNRIRVGTHLYSCFEVLVPLKLTVAECSNSYPKKEFVLNFTTRKHKLFVICRYWPGNRTRGLVGGNLKYSRLDL